MTAGVNMTLCPNDETLAAFIDGRLKGADRQAVIDHLAECAECRDVVVLADEVRTAEGFPAPVPVPDDDNVVPFRRWIAPLTVAASVALVLFVARDPIANQFNGGMTDVVRAYEKDELREVKTRLSGLPYEKFNEPKRGAESGVPESNVPHLEEKRADLEDEAGDRSWREYRALAAARLLTKDYAGAVEAIESAAKLAPEEPAVLNDLAAAYVVAAENRKIDPQRAIAAAERAWKVTQSLESAWNRAVAYQVANRDAAAIRAWQEYLKLDPSSPWTAEAQRSLELLQPLD
jgi:hypothetical protein